MGAILAAVLFFFPMRSCSKNFDAGLTTEGPAAPRSGSQRAAAPAGAASGRRAFTAPGIRFEPPQEWIPESPSSSMRKAQYRLPAVEGDPESAELIVFYFAGGGGGVQANINRWVGQFSLPGGGSARSASKTSTRESNGIPLTVLDVRGTYHRSVGAPMSGQTEPVPNFRMLAAVAETSAGPYFFKLTGPEKTVDAWEDEFDRFLQTIAPNPG
ncbi:MAG: hypothetical protein V3T83_22190 [Acidobacteriota bacterium]